MNNTLKHILILYTILVTAVTGAQTSEEKLNTRINACKNNKERITVFLTISDKLYNKGDYNKSLIFAQKAIKLAVKTKINTELARSYTQVGSIYLELGSFDKALENNLNALKISEEIGDIKQGAYVHHNIANIYREQGDLKKSLHNYQISLKLCNSLNDKKGISRSYFGIGLIHRAMENYTLALEYYFKSIQIDEKRDDIEAIGHTYTSVAIVYSILGNFDKALPYYAKSLKIAQRKGDKKELALCKINLGCAYSDLGDYSSAEINLKEALTLFASISHQNGVKEVYASLADLYEKKKDFGNALKYQKKFNELKDKLLSENTSKQILELNAKYESEKKNIQNKTLMQKNRIQALTISNSRFLIVGLAVVLLLLVGLGFVVIRQKKMKAIQTNMLFEQKLLRTQMNPHFIFNSLASIESFIYEHEPKTAGVYLSKFSRLMRLILENSASEYISLDKEIELLNYYLALQKMRLDDQLDYSFHVQDNISKEEIMMPPMLLQPFIENAIEHGFRGSGNRGEISIRFEVVQESLQVTIEDNGIGINRSESSKEIDKEHKSMALKITQERLQLLNKSKRKKLTFSIEDKQNTDSALTGTRVLFTIPLEFK